MGNILKIAISGKARVGKNTVAEMLVQHSKLNGNQWKIAALADPMKNIIKSMFPEANKQCLFGASELRSEIIDDKYRDKNNQPLTYRQALIDLGAYGRSYNNNIWLNCLIEDVKNNQDKQLYIISDVRYSIEYDYLKAAGFDMIRILRSDHTKIDDPSETEQDLISNDGFDYVIQNNRSLITLSEQVGNVLESIMLTHKNIMSKYDLYSDLQGVEYAR